MDDILATLLKKLGPEANKKFGTEFGVLKTDEERFLYTLNFAEKLKLVPEIKLQRKNSRDSIGFRRTGNMFYETKKWRSCCDKILKLYTKSIAYAELNSPELAYAYGNRSALLFNARIYEHALLDIERALAMDVPEDLMPKLLRRRANCLQALGDKCKNIKTNVPKKGRKNRRAVENIEILPPPRKLFDEEKYKPDVTCDNPEIPGATSAIKICYDQKFGRHVRATRDIKPGEPICIQRGYTTVLAPDCYYTHCSYCLKQTWSAVACRKCTAVVYCNETCRDKAWKSHHDVECSVINSMFNLEMDFCLMSLRIAVQAVREAGSFEALRDKIKALELHKDPRTVGMKGTPPVLDQTDYCSVYTLATNVESRSVGDLFGRSFNALYIVYFVAVLTNFFGEKLPQDFKALKKNQWVGFFGGLITRHLQIIPTNVHEVTESFEMGERERGSSLIPFLSLFNHHCEGMVTRDNFGADIVVYALFPIKAGEQIFDNYGTHYSLHSLYLRKRKLKQYFFNCECQPCIENWPTLPMIISFKDMGLSKKAIAEVSHALKNFEDCVLIVMSSNIEKYVVAIKHLERMIAVLSEHVERPCLEMCNLVETLKRGYALISIRWQSLNSD